jgi:transposase-like protein
MSRKKTKYSTELKTKLVLEVLKGEKTLNEIASANSIIPKNLQNWKATFLANAELAMEPSKAVKEGCNLNFTKKRFKLFRIKHTPYSFGSTVK